MKEKVYCKNCIGRRWYYSHSFGYLCRVYSRYKIDEVSKKAGAPACSDINRSYNCKDYKRKWWKIWIK